VQRAESISEQLLPPADPIQFDAQGQALLTGWGHRRATQPRGRIQFDKTERDGRKLLLISASDGGGTGSWRTQTRLPAGNYRFEGRVKTSGAGPTSGVCLRVSGARNVRVISSEDDWTLLTYPISVELPEVEVVLICEFRSSNGEAAFDEESLRLVRE
jgi:hypothetical protein